MPNELNESRIEQNFNAAESSAAAAMSHESHSISKLNKGNAENTKPIESGILPGLTITSSVETSAENTGKNNERSTGSDAHQSAESAGKNREHSASSEAHKGRSRGAGKTSSENQAESLTDIPKQIQGDHLKTGEETSYNKNLPDNGDAKPSHTYSDKNNQYESKPDLWTDGKLQGGGATIARPDIWSNGKLEGADSFSAKPDFLKNHHK